MQLGQCLLERLRKRGQGRGLELLLSRCDEAVLQNVDHPLTELLSRCDAAEERGVVEPLLELLDGSLERLCDQRQRFEPWLGGRLASVWSHEPVRSVGALAEVEALGVLVSEFSSSSPVREKSNEQTPDFRAASELCCDVYTPRESQQNKETVARELETQSGMVRIALSHPLTGSGGQSLEYPANKVADRFLNAKRRSRQQSPTEPTILYVDARRAWGLSAEDTLPFRTVYSKGVHWVGTFGVWHAFYGAAGKRVMLRDRASLVSLGSSDAYEQQGDGLFRENSRWAGAIIAVRDGLVFFENPWAANPLTHQTVRKLLRLDRTRAEYSWFRTPSVDALRAAVEAMLDRMEWTFRPDDREQVQSEDA